jgi:(heptosyl)LPS beta-1,4-glucosyltransferase
LANRKLGKINKSNSGVTLGVVAISLNEERDLPGFIENLIPWVDEVVIIDDGSTDHTCEIADKAGEKVHLVVSPRLSGTYYADQRNKGIEAARSDWLLHMDIDERVSTDLALEILEAIRNPAYAAYRFRRKNYFLHRPMQGGDWINWNLVHLARRDSLHFSGMYHEEIELSVSSERVGQLKNFMIHLNDESYEERLRKSSVYQIEVAERIKRTHKSLGYLDIVWSFLGEFIYQYLWKRGFLDGVLGLVWAFHAASANTRAYILAWDEQNRISRDELEKKIRSMWDEQNLERMLTQKKLE